MKHKHTIMLVLLGWLLALFMPPQAIFAKVKGKV